MVQADRSPSVVLVAVLVGLVLLTFGAVIALTSPTFVPISDESGPGENETEPADGPALDRSPDPDIEESTGDPDFEESDLDRSTGDLETYEEPDDVDESAGGLTVSVASEDRTEGDDSAGAGGDENDVDGTTPTEAGSETTSRDEPSDGDPGPPEHAASASDESSSDDRGPPDRSGRPGADRGPDDSGPPFGDRSD